jgi:hypothetical protein
VYVVVMPGVTVTDPLFALPVEKLVPVQDAAFADCQVRVAELPATIVLPGPVRYAHGFVVTVTVREAVPF